MKTSNGNQQEDMDDFEESSREQDYRILDSHAAQLGERFDSVQIVVTYQCPQNGTVMRGRGDGNGYARIGAVEEWLKTYKK